MYLFVIDILDAIATTNVRCGEASSIFFENRKKCLGFGKKTLTSSILGFSF